MTSRALSPSSFFLSPADTLQLGRLAGLIPTELGRLVGLQVFGWQN
jgi:hypothetical protein